MRRVLLATTSVAWLALIGSAGAATVTLKEGPADPQYFAPEPAHANGFTLDGISWSLVSGVAETEKGSLAGQYAAPFGMGTTSSGTTYMAVESGGTEKAVWAKSQTSLTIYWGSIDAQSVDGITNTLTITFLGGGTPFTLTGEDLIPKGALGAGDQQNPKDNQFVTITGLSPFTTVEFSDSGKNAFEFSLGSAVPEPSTWAMMALGFAGLGYAAFRRNLKKGQTAVAI
jgi:hypothetical protein